MTLGGSLNVLEFGLQQTIGVYSLSWHPHPGWTQSTRDTWVGRMPSTCKLHAMQCDKFRADMTESELSVVPEFLWVPIVEVAMQQELRC